MSTSLARGISDRTELVHPGGGFRRAVGGRSTHCCWGVAAYSKYISQAGGFSKRPAAKASPTSLMFKGQKGTKGATWTTKMGFDLTPKVEVDMVTIAIGKLTGVVSSKPYLAGAG